MRHLTDAMTISLNAKINNQKRGITEAGKRALFTAAAFSVII